MTARRRRKGGETTEEMKTRERKEKICELCVFGGTLDINNFIDGT